MSGGTQQVRQTTSTELTPEQKSLVSLAMPGLKAYAANPPKLPDYSRIAGFDPLQTQGQQMALDATGKQAAQADAAGSANQFLLGSALNPDSNQYLQKYMAAAARPIQDNLLESTLPAIRSEAATTGNFGSSRQGIAEGLASKGASQAIGDATAKIASDAYGQGLTAMGGAVSAAPGVMANYLTPGLTTSGVGDVRQSLAQAQLGEKASDFNYNQLAPYLTSSDLLAAAYGIPGGSTTSTASGGGNSLLGNVMGGVSLGSALGSAIPGIGTGIGALGGGALSALLGLL